MVEASTSQGRYFLLKDGPVASPAQCGICGYGGSDREYIDPRLDFEFYGTLIFCEECVGSMSRLFDYLSPAVAKTLEGRLERAEAELITLRGALLALENFNDAIAGLVNPHDNFLADDGSVVSGSTEGASELPFDEDSDSGSDKSGSDESRDERGRNDLRNAVTTESVPGGLSL